MAAEGKPMPADLLARITNEDDQPRKDVLDDAMGMPTPPAATGPDQEMDRDTLAAAAAAANARMPAKN